MMAISDMTRANFVVQRFSFSIDSGNDNQETFYLIQCQP